MPVTITAERPDAPDAAALVEELDAHLATLYPRESRHGLSVQRLIDENVAFFVIRDERDAPAGCGGVKLLGTDYGELKRMYVRPAYRGRGLGRMLLDHLAAHARAHRVSCLRLETGIYQHAAIMMYERFGFVRIAPFPPYREDPLSRCYEMRLATPANTSG